MWYFFILNVGFICVSAEDGVKKHCKDIKWKKKKKKVFQLNCKPFYLQMAEIDQVILGITWIIHKSNFIILINFDME